MSESADAIVIGSGVIGCATAFELAKKGYKTLSIDKLPDAGYGSTSNSCERSSPLLTCRLNVSKLEGEVSRLARAGRDATTISACFCRMHHSVVARV